MGKSTIVRIWTDKEFAKLLKKTAINNNMTCKGFTEQAVNNPNLFKELELEAKDNKKKKGGFDSIF